MTTEETPTSCANCGKAERGETKLKACSACKLVKYCGRDCQIAHRSQHKKACMKRAAELHDEALFRQPPKRDDCPICFLLLPALGPGSAFRACCGKMICTGCFHEHQLQSNGRPTCPFCREDTPSSEKEYIKMLHKRDDANDAAAIHELALHYSNGAEKDMNKAVKLFHRAADLGSFEAYHKLAHMYFNGNCVVKDEKKAKQYHEKAAMAGCIGSRFNLGCMDATAGSFDRAIKHWLIGASCGDVRAVNYIKKAMTMGKATKDHYAQALRGYKQNLDDVRSDNRDRAAAYSDEYKYLLEEIQ